MLWCCRKSEKVHTIRRHQWQLVKEILVVKRAETVFKRCCFWKCQIHRAYIWLFTFQLCASESVKQRCRWWELNISKIVAHSRACLLYWSSSCCSCDDQGDRIVHQRYQFVRLLESGLSNAPTAPTTIFLFASNTIVDYL